MNGKLWAGLGLLGAALLAWLGPMLTGNLPTNYTGEQNAMAIGIAATLGAVLIYLGAKRQ